MKRIEIMIGMMALLMIVSCATQQERAEQRVKTRLEVKEAIATKQLHIDIKSMNTMRYGSMMVTPDFFLELRGDTLRSYLPYLGQVHQAPMNSPAIGLNFEMPIQRYSESRPKANRTQLDLDVKTQEDTYRYQIDVYDTGDAHIHVRSINRDPISFDGTFAPIEK